MELRSRRKNDPSPARDMSLRILLASIGLAIYASVLEAQSISIDKLAECSDDDMVLPIQKIDEGPGEDNKTTSKVDTIDVGKTNTVVTSP